MRTGFLPFALISSIAILGPAAMYGARPDPVGPQAQGIAAAALTVHHAAVALANATPAATGQVSASTLTPYLPATYTAVPTITWTTCIAPGTPRVVVTTTTPANLPPALKAPQISAALATISGNDPGTGIASNANTVIPAATAYAAQMALPTGAPCGPITAGTPVIVTTLGS